MPAKRGNQKTETPEATGLSSVGNLSEDTGGPQEAEGMGTEAILAAIATLRSEMKTSKTEICGKIEDKVSEWRGLVGVTEVSYRASDCITELEAIVANLRSQVGSFTEKCIEGHSKRQNLRIVGLKESTEHGAKTRDFVVELLMEALKLEEKPLIDRAHRALRSRPEPEAQPRHIIARLHYCHAVEDIISQACKTRELLFHGQKIRTFRDLPNSVVQKRAAFNPAKALLRDKPGVRFGLLYPARLCVTLNGKESIFTDPQDALKFANHHFSPDREKK
ncbi:hypothetical protein NFI96_032821 [Prochilodus magdalenae]|nr:hypothetical protein NFI96_032821 [Prochilodus magdalenae]